MIFHNLYTFTIGQFAEMLETGDINRCKRVKIWLPKKIVSNGYTNLIKAFNEESNKKQVKQKVNDGFDMLSVNYQLQWFEAMEKMIGIWYQITGTDKDSVKSDIDGLFKTKYGKVPTEKDLLRIPKDHKLLIEKAMQVFPDPKENDKVDFEANIISLESALAPITIRDKKLYLFNKYVELALKKIKTE